MLIQFGILKIKLIIPIIFPFFLKLRRIVRTKNKINSYVFRGFNDFLSLTIFGIFYLIVKFRTKATKDIIEKQTIKKQQELSSVNEINGNKQIFINSIAQIENDNLKKQKKQEKKQFLFILLISGLQLITVVIKSVWRIKLNDVLRLNSQALIQIIFLITFSVCILGFSIYSHQIFSIIIILICLLIFFFESIIYHKVGFTDIILGILYYISIQAFYCLSDVLGKKYLNTYLDNLYLFLFKIGIIGLIPLIIFGFLTLIVDVNEKYHLFQFFSKIDFWIFLLDLFFSCLFELGLWLTIYYFSPCHYIIYESIANFLEIILAKVNGIEGIFSRGEIITFYILYPVFILGTIVFNEIIILNFWGLNYNTKKEIMKRETIDGAFQGNNNLDDNIEHDNYNFSLKNDEYNL